MPKEKEIKVVIAPANAKSRIVIMENDLERYQRFVGGLIQVVPADFEVNEQQLYYICNDEGKLNGLSPSRAIYLQHGKASDVIFGDFLVTKSSEEGNWVSLTDEECIFVTNEIEHPSRDPCPHLYEIMANSASGR